MHKQVLQLFCAKQRITTIIDSSFNYIFTSVYCTFRIVINLIFSICETDLKMIKFKVFNAAFIYQNLDFHDSTQPVAAQYFRVYSSPS